MSKHTPGPWAVDRYCRDITPVGRYLRIAEIPGHRENDTPDSQEREANARLIAAAPDLLAALEAACDIIDLEAAIYSARAKVEHETANTRSAGNLKAKVNFFRATIAKATGGDL